MSSDVLARRGEFAYEFAFDGMKVELEGRGSASRAENPQAQKFHGIEFKQLPVSARVAASLRSGEGQPTPRTRRTTFRKFN
jgi:hypothetical protein